MNEPASTERIAIVGIGLTYPDTATPGQLWENVLAGRRAFRRLPDVRTNRADYYSPDPHAPDRFYADRAAVLRDWSFDRLAYRVAGSTYRSTDTTHWLALDVTARALADAGYPDGAGLPHQTTGVVLGNSLTGEFSRANVMRLRWPYVRRVVATALAEEGWADADVARFLRTVAARYKAPFPAIDEDTLAGGLANTIAGRICNYFDLAGGGFTVDGACSSSLLAVATAAGALVEHDLDVAVAGGVDLSIDPFELIGFAKTGALATGEMKVYDKGSNGFWPGEGAGALVLMREQDALERGARIYASITGWGVSSDGKGGMTRPEADGHRLALARAYRRAGYGVETVSYFEGHGTGTALGDATEIEALSGARRAAAPGAAKAALGTVKGNFGHTKAAAGVAGLIKATLAVHHQVIPPVTGNTEPHPLLTAPDAAMYLPGTAQLWPSDQEIRAGVSAMGFGGINSHVALERATGTPRRTDLDADTVATVAGRQDAEVLLLDADDRDALLALARQLVPLAADIAMAELADLAGELACRLAGRPMRAAVVAGRPEECHRGLTRLVELLEAGENTALDPAGGVFLAAATTRPRVGFLFPGQGAGRAGSSALRRRFPVAEEVHDAAGLAGASGDQVATEVAQPRIVAGSVAGLRVLAALGIEGDVAVGHSLGELTALHWAGAMDEAQVLALASVRGRVMADTGGSDGAMAGLAVGPATAGELAGDDAVIAGYNGPHQTVVSGSSAAIERICARARAQGVQATRLPVSHAFHSPAVEQAATAMAEPLTAVGFARLRRPVVSTVTGDVLHGAEDLVTLLRDQIVLPVRFREAAEQVAQRSDLLVEVGPGRILTGLAAQIDPDTPALALDTDSPSLSPLLRVVGAAFVLGVPVDVAALFAGRVVRPLPLDGAMSFLTNPCEAAPAIGAELVAEPQAAVAHAVAGTQVGAGATSTTLDLLRTLAAARVELPVEALDADTHPLDDLHLSSITVGQIVNEVTRALGRPALEGMPNFATVCLGELAEMIDELAQTERPDDATTRGEVVGVAPWVRPFAVEHVQAPRPSSDSGRGASTAEWSVFAPQNHPLAEPLRAGLAGAGIGNGVVLCLPADADEHHFGLFLTAGRTALAAPSGTRFVVVQQGLGASGLARTLRLEDPSTRTTIVELPDVLVTEPDAIAEAVACVVAETAATHDYAEARYDADGFRWVPALRTVPPAVGAVPALGADDVLLVTGGGKGITAECALALAQDSGAALVLLGRSAADGDAELVGNLARMDAAGVRYRYEQADVTSREQVGDAVERAQAALGPVTAVLHGAGRNEPGALFSLTEESFRSTVAPKISGLRAVLDAVDQDRIKLLVTFGSIIGRAGLRGEAHYATANDWMTELTVRFGRDHPQAKVLACEWSVWSGAGMGEKLGVVSALQRDGITPIPTEDGIAVLRALLADPQAPPVTVVCGRTAGLPTLPVERTELPLHRFVDRVVVHYPSIELVTEADLTAGSDPYLGDHLLDGDLLFPAVMGMEAMTQVACAVTGTGGVPTLSGVEFLRPIVVPPTGSTTIRIAALAHDATTVEVVVRSGETGFSADHFRARLRFDRDALPDVPDSPLALPEVACDPVNELYGSVLFQGKRFQRLTAYRRAAARRAVATVASGDQPGWFATFLPQQLLLADPGTRDVMMHAIQCCVPDATLLPQSIEELHLADRGAQDGGHVVLDARERSQYGDSYVYDLDVRDPDGRLVERWVGLSLRAVRKRGGAGPWSPAMLGPHLERTLETVLGGQRAVVVEPDPAGAPARTVAQRRVQTELAAGRAIGGPTELRYRPDGKPEADSVEVSASHAAGLTLVVTGAERLACDAETVVERSEEDWAGLLGSDLLALRGLLAVDLGEPVGVSATRVWTAIECIRKIGSSTHALTVHSVHPGGWALLSAGAAQVATWVTTVHGRSEPIVFAVLATRED